MDAWLGSRARAKTAGFIEAGGPPGRMEDGNYLFSYNILGPCNCWGAGYAILDVPSLALREQRVAAGDHDRAPVACGGAGRGSTPQEEGCGSPPACITCVPICSYVINMCAYLQRRRAPGRPRPSVPESRVMHAHGVAAVVVFAGDWISQ